MEIMIGIVILCIFASAHFSQKAVQELRKLNSNVEELVRTLKAK